MPSAEAPHLATVVTSSVRGEGRSTVAANLALCTAVLGKHLEVGFGKVSNIGKGGKKGMMRGGLGSILPGSGRGPGGFGGMG